MGGEEYIAIHSKEEYEQALEVSADKLVMIDFYATWCGPCKIIAPKVAKIWGENDKNNIALYKCDVDEVEELAMELGVSAMPTFFFFSKKEQIDQFVGANVDELKSRMEVGHFFSIICFAIIHCLPIFTLAFFFLF